MLTPHLGRPTVNTRDAARLTAGYIAVVTRSTSFRLSAIAAALLLCFSGSGVVYAHALVHLHSAREHSAHTDGLRHAVAPEAAAEVEATEHSHEHDHAVVDVASNTRELTRFIASLAILPSPVRLPVHVSSDVRRQAITLALLPRPGPGVGPPGGPRAPPIG